MLHLFSPPPPTLPLPCVHSRSQGYGKTRTCAVVKLHEATQMFVMVDYVRDLTVKKS